MDEKTIRNVLEAALLGAGRPLNLDQLCALFGKRGAPSRAEVKAALEGLVAEYEERGIQLIQVASGWRIQIRKSMGDWLMPLWEERAPRYSRALLETLALIAYRQPITRGEIEEVRGVAVSTNITRTLLERGWVKIVGHRDVPGRPAMFATTREFLDYFGLKRLEDLPPLSEIKDLDALVPSVDLPQTFPQDDMLEVLSDELQPSEGLAEETETPSADDEAPAQEAAEESPEVSSEEPEEEAPEETSAPRDGADVVELRQPGPV